MDIRYYPAIRDRFGIEIGTQEKNGYVEYQYICPFCMDIVGTPDLSGHLFARSDNGIYHCYRCSAKGALYLPDVPISPSNVLLTKMANNYLNNSKGISMEEYEIDDKSKFIYEIPNRMIHENSIALKYMIDRGFSNELLEYYNVRIGSILDKYIGRIIIPNEVFKDIS